MKRKIFVSSAVLLAILMSCSKKEYPDLGAGYKFETVDGNSLEIINSENSVVIGTEILNYAFDSNFIVVSQRPWDVSGINEVTYYKRNDAFENSNFLQYWIINKKEQGNYSFDSLTQLAKYSNVYGPFQKEEYLKKHEELGVSKELRLNE